MLREYIPCPECCVCFLSFEAPQSLSLIISTFQGGLDLLASPISGEEALLLMAAEPAKCMPGMQRQSMLPGGLYVSFPSPQNAPASCKPCVHLCWYQQHGLAGEWLLCYSPERKEQARAGA